MGVTCVGSRWKVEAPTIRLATLPRPRDWVLRPAVSEASYGMIPKSGRRFSEKIMLYR